MSVLLTVDLRYEQDIVLARQRARQIAALLAFEQQDQTRIATAVSEIARNAYQYATGGRVEFALDDRPVPALRLTVSDRGTGIRDLRSILRGTYVSRTGMGIGLTGAKRIMDDMSIETSPTGTTVTMLKQLTLRSGIAPASSSAIGAELAKALPQTAFEEVRQQNQELFHALSELQARQTELDYLNRELADTNRGVMALYAELEDKAQQLQRASDMKSAFLSGISHEFRTPLNSIVGLARLLQGRIDGPLTSEQEKQVNFIRLSAEMLSELVNDLLDTAKIEAGKVTIQSREFTVVDLFSTLRGMFRPLIQGAPGINSAPISVALEFSDAALLPVLHSDDGKIAQILRNLISNALKFTEQGSVQISATLLSGDDIEFAVADTGIGIAEEDRVRIFTDFEQVTGTHQRHVKGTGLGLPLSRKLAELLGGTITVTSELGVGSIFRVCLPIHYHGPDEAIVGGADWLRDTPDKTGNQVRRNDR